ncbi:MAG: hypothetical protein J6D06_07045 [Clostridia bacterium]|nr:hypothetical protein [Clostridia bacterium]
MDNFKKIIAMIFVLIYGFISCFAVIGTMTGKYTTSYDGFAVDKEENVYIGYPEGKIKVYKDKKYLKTIFSGTNRGVDFTIVDGDKIYVYIAPQGYFLDLNGKRIEYQGGEFDSFYTYRPQKSEFVFDDGVIYKQKFNMGRTKIVKISADIIETVYQMPLEDYIVKIIIFLDYILLVVVVIYLFYVKLVKRNA